MHRYISVLKKDLKMHMVHHNYKGKTLRTTTPGQFSVFHLANTKECYFVLCNCKDIFECIIIDIDVFFYVKILTDIYFPLIKIP